MLNQHTNKALSYNEMVCHVLKQKQIKQLISNTTCNYDLNIFIYNQTITWYGSNQTEMTSNIELHSIPSGCYGFQSFQASLS